MNRYWCVGISNLSLALMTWALPVVAAPIPSANPDLGQENIGNPSMSVVTSVSQLSDVQPTDWAFQALQSLVERYGCIAGYPDGTYKGGRALSRYEFAAGLNACMDRVNELIAAGTADLVTRADLDTLKALQAQFAEELAVLRGRVDSLEARATVLESQQFSTTTKLAGEVIFSVGSVFAGDDATGAEITRNATFGHRVRLNFETSFTGRDLLRTRLQTGNLVDYTGNAGLSEGTLKYSAGNPSSNIELDALFYQFPIGDRTMVTIEANAGASDDFAETINPFIDGDGGAGALTQFGTRNPIYYYLDGNGGLGIQHEFNDSLTLSLGYIAANSESPTPGNGLFNGAYGAMGQILFKPSDRFKLGLYYINAYNQDITTGSNTANLVNFTGLNVVTNSYGVGASFEISPQFVLNAWGGYTTARILGAGDADIWNFAVTAAFPDLGGKGNLGGLVFGMEPRVSNVQGTVLNGLIAGDPDTSFHIEGFYSWRVQDNIAITPAVIWLTAPNHNNTNDDIVMGIIRTTFSF